MNFAHATALTAFLCVSSTGFAQPSACDAIPPISVATVALGKVFGYDFKADSGAAQFQCNQARSCRFGFQPAGEKAGSSGTISVAHPSDEMNLNYKIQVNGDFMSARGGKLPGFCGDETGSGHTATGGNYSGDGFSVRPMFHSDGGKMCVYAYVYQKGNPNGGDQSADEQAGGDGRKGQYFPARKSSDACFSSNSKVQLSLNVRLGPAGGQRDCVHLMLNGKDVVNRCDFDLRHEPETRMRRVCMHVFAGGDKSWAPNSPSAALCMTDFIISASNSPAASKLPVSEILR